MSRIRQIVIGGVVTDHHAMKMTLKTKCGNISAGGAKEKLLRQPNNCCLFVC